MSKNSAPEKYGKDYDEGPPEEDPISDCIGEYGRWQFRNTFLLALFSFPCTFHIFSPTFSAATRDFWCARPHHLSSLSPEDWIRYSGSQDRCQILDYDWNSVDTTTIADYPFGNGSSTYIPCNDWEFDTSQITKTVISDWGLVCDNAYWTTVAEVVFLSGVGVGGIVTGFLSDRLGRKNALMVSLLSQGLFGVGIFFSQQIEFFLVLKFLLGFSCVSVVNAGFVLSVELVGGKWRTIAGICNFFPLPVSYMLVSGVSLLLPDWRHLQLALSLPGLFLVLLWWVLPESPRWLLSMGKIEELKSLLRKAASENKRQLPSNMDKLLMPSGDSDGGDNVGVADLFKGKMLKTTIVALWAWFVITLAYYGLVLNVGSFGADLYLTSFLSGAVELVAIALSIPVLLKIGRRYPISGTLILSGVACLCSVFVRDESLLWLKLTFILIGKFGAGAINGALPMYTAELFPTLLRNLGMGAGQVSAGISLIIMPYLWQLAKYADQLPMGIVAALAISGGLSILLLPETGNKPLSGKIDNEKTIISKPKMTENGKSGNNKNSSVYTVGA